MYYKPDWQMTKKRLEAFWAGEIIDRCVVSVTAPREGAAPQCGTVPMTSSEAMKYWFDPEETLKRNISRMENTCFLGDAFPQIHHGMGASAHAGLFRNTEYKYLDSAWFFPQNTGEEPEEIEFDEGSFLYKRTVEIAKYLAAENRGRYFISQPDFTGNLDALAHIRGSENLLMDLMLNPEWVHRSLGKIQDAWRRIMEELYPILSAQNEGGTTIGWLNTWHSGRHAQLQCDISVMLSVPMFDAFAKPELREQSAWMDCGLYHLDGQEQCRHLDTLLSIEGIQAIQWTSVAGQPPASAFIPVLRRIQQSGKRLVIMPSSAEDYTALLTSLSSKGLQLIMQADTAYDAREIIKIAHRLTHD